VAFESFLLTLPDQECWNGREWENHNKLRYEDFGRPRSKWGM